MSTFPGVIEEIPGISVDRFDGENLKSSAYFLSHCHCDHMRGLNESFFNNLVDRKQFLYCTALSKLFLEGKYRLNERQSENIRVVVPCSPIIVEHVSNGQQESLTVSSVNAGHCPGSVMFIFERENVSILYTGDFRISPSDLPKLKPLHDQAGATRSPKKFAKIYLDTTFLTPDFRDFPSRQESLSVIRRVAGDWIARDPKNVVILECSANYGSEYLFMELSESLKKRVHVKSWVYQDFSRIPELERCITDDGRITPIHACMAKNDKGPLACRDVTSANILTIVPSALRWKGRDLSETIYERDPHDHRRICVALSMHSSYNEIKTFIEYFGASKFFACVQPPNCADNIQDRLDEMTMKTVKKEYSASETYKLESLKKKNPRRTRVKSQYFSDDSSD